MAKAVLYMQELPGVVKAEDLGASLAVRHLCRVDPVGECEGISLHFVVP